jgi:hypothetical protein
MGVWEVPEVSGVRVVEGEPVAVRVGYREDEPATIGVISC